MDNLNPEMSNYDGRPVQLFDFNRGTLHWRYARADQDIVFQGDTYMAIGGLMETGVRQNVDAGENDLTITVPADSDIAQLYVSNTPSDRMYITIWVFDLDDEANPRGRMYWKGSVGGKAQGDNNSSKLNCQDLAVGFSRSGLRLAWERGCPHTLYDNECRVAPESFEVLGTLTQAKGDNMSASILGNFVDGYFAGGFVKWAIAEGIYQRRGIEAHTGNNISVIGGVSTLQEGDVVLFYPGCGHSISICDSKFGNKLNFGGVPNLKGDSPFSGNPVFN